NLSCFMQPGNELIDLGTRRIKPERGPGRRRNIEEIHHRPAAMMPGPDGDPLAAQNRAGIMGMGALHHKGYERRMIAGATDDLKPRNLANPLHSIAENLMLMGSDGLDPERIHIIDGRPEADDPGDMRRSGFEFMRQIVPFGLLERDRTD